MVKIVLIRHEIPTNQSINQSINQFINQKPIGPLIKRFMSQVFDGVDYEIWYERHFGPIFFFNLQAMHILYVERVHKYQLSNCAWDFDVIRLSAVRQFIARFFSFKLSNSLFISRCLDFCC